MWAISTRMDTLSPFIEVDEQIADIAVVADLMAGRPDLSLGLTSSYSAKAFRIVPQSSRFTTDRSPVARPNFTIDGIKHASGPVS